MLRLLFLFQMISNLRPGNKDWGVPRNDRDRDLMAGTRVTNALDGGTDRDNHWIGAGTDLDVEAGLQRLEQLANSAGAELAAV